MTSTSVYNPERVGTECPTCGRSMLAELRTIRSLATDGALLTEIRDGTLFTFVCSHCHTATQLPHPVLVYHPAHLPTMLFVAMPGASRQENQWMSTDLAQVVRAAESMTQPPYVMWGDLPAIARIVGQWLEPAAEPVDEAPPPGSFEELKARVRHQLEPARSDPGGGVPAVERAIADLEAARGRFDAAADDAIDRLLPTLAALLVERRFIRIEYLLDPEHGSTPDRMREAIAAAAALSRQTTGRDHAKAEVYRATAQYRWQQSTGVDDHREPIAVVEAVLPVLRQDDDRRMLVAALNNLALMYFGQASSAGTDRAIGLWTEVLEVTGPDDHDGRAAAHLNLEMAFERRGDGAASLYHAQQAILRFDRPESRVRWAVAHMNLGTHYLRSDSHDRPADVERARAALELAATVLTPDGTPVEWEFLQINLGGCYQHRYAGNRADNIERALTHFGNALSAHHPDGSVELWAAARVGYAICLLDRGVEPVDRVERQAIDMITEVLERVGDGPVAVECHAHLGSLYSRRVDRGVVGDAGRAVEHADIACARLDRTTQARRWAMLRSGLGLVHAKLEPPDFATALACAGEAVTALDPVRHALEWGVAHLNLAVIHQVRDDLPAAVVHCGHALSALGVGRAPDYRVRAATIKGECHAAAGQWTDAAEAFGLAAAAFRHAYDGSERASGRVALLHRASVCHTSAAVASARAGDPRRAVEYAEAGRSFALREALDLDPATLDPVVDRGTPGYERYLAALSALRAAEAETRPPNLAHAGLTAQQARLSDEHRLAALESARRAAVEARAAVAEPRPVDLAAICEYTADADAVCYLLSSPWGTELLTVRPGTGEVTRQPYALTHAELWKLMVPADGPDSGTGLLLGAVVGGDTIRRAVNGFAASPVAAWLRDALPAGDRVVVVPMGLWSVVPLSLVVPGRTALVHAASAEVYHRCRVRAAQPVTGRSGVLAYGDRGVNLAAREVAEVRAAFADGTTVEPGPGAKDDLIGRLPHHDHLHLATHGVYALDEPTESAIRVGGEDLLVRELVARQLLAGIRLVFLSACQSGMSDVLTRRDEVIGLPSACIYSGAMGVVATLWRVDDDATFLFVRRFYREYRDHGPATAVALARDWLRTVTAAEVLAGFEEVPASLVHLRLRPRGSRPFADPVFWAPFVYVGA